MKTKSLNYSALLEKLANRAFDKFMSGSREGRFSGVDTELLAEIYGVDPELFIEHLDGAYCYASDENYAKYSQGGI
jgi:hypothetical protein